MERAIAMPSSLPVSRLGRSVLTVSKLGLGAAPLGDLFDTLNERTAMETVAAALQGGITLIDISPHYGNGLAELRVGAGIRFAAGARPVISTKVGRVMNPFEKRGAIVHFKGGLPHAARFDYSADGAKRSLEQSLLRLGTDRIDIVLIHDVDVWTHGPKAIAGRIREVLDGAYPAMAKWRDEGVIGAVGFGLNEADMAALFARETDMDAVLLAGRYSLLEQPALDEFFPLAAEKGIGVMLGGVFNSGILATGAKPGAVYNYKTAPPDILARADAIEKICARHGVPLRVAALQFAAAHPVVSSVVLGAVTPQEIQSNIAAMQTIIPAALWQELKQQGLLARGAPVPGVT